MKKCNQCKIYKDAADFYHSLSYKRGLSTYCKRCTIQKQSAWGKSHPIRLRNNRAALYHVKRLTSHGLTEANYQSILQLQKGRCAICLSDKTGIYNTWCIDHDHKTDKVRGLLCFSCNVGLGSFKDSFDNLNRAIAYLKNPYRVEEL